MQYPDCMIDIETTGTSPDRTNIIQIAAVRFNLKEGTVDPNFFDRCLAPLPTRFWDESTRLWWSSMPDLLARITSRMEPAHRVMKDLSEWGEGGGSFWAKPITFDYTFVASYFNELEILNPWNFRRTMDQNTFIRSRHFPKEPPKYEKLIDFDGEQHDAIADVLHQIKVVAAAYEATK